MTFPAGMSARDPDKCRCPQAARDDCRGRSRAASITSRRAASAALTSSRRADVTPAASSRVSGRQCQLVPAAVPRPSQPRTMTADGLVPIIRCAADAGLLWNRFRWIRYRQGLFSVYFGMSRLPYRFLFYTTRDEVDEIECKSDVIEENMAAWPESNMD